MGTDADVIPPNPNNHSLTDILNKIGRGDLRRLLDQRSAETFAILHKLSLQNPDSKIKGSITLSLKLSVEGGVADIVPEISTKVPQKETVQKSVYWLTPEGKLSTQHPQQTNLLDHVPQS